MTAQNSLAAALRTVRKSRSLSQEAFSDVSSRTYLSSLERGLKSPTLNKLEELCGIMRVHPLTLLTLAYASDEKSQSKLALRITEELEELKRNSVATQTRARS